MSTRTRLSAVAASIVAAGLLAAPSYAADGDTHVVFVQNDDPSGNVVIAYDRTPSGGLTEVGSYSTGGLGGVLAGSVVDHLASEGSLTYDAGSGLLLAVNAGSDTVTAFSVHGDQLSRTQVIGSGGSFPVSVTANAGRVFVLNARGGGSVQGYRIVAGRLVRVAAWHRGLGLDPTQTPEFTSTPGQIGFTPDGSQLVVTTKNGGNSVLVYRLRAGRLLQPVATSLPGTVPFGFAFDSAGDLALTEAGTNSVVTFAVGGDGSLTPLDSAATGQAATCWLVADAGTVYASNAGSGTLSGYAVGAGGGLTSLGNTATDPGTVDAAVSGDGAYLYAQAGRNGTVDAFAIANDGSLTETGSVTVPDAAGAEGIVAL